MRTSGKRKIIGFAALFVLWGGLQSFLAAQEATVVRNGLVVTGTRTQKYVRGAYNSIDDEYFIVWFDNRTGVPRIRGMRLKSDGLPVDGTHIAINPGIDTIQADIAFNPQLGEYFIVWSAGGDIYGRYMDRLGNFLGDSFPIATGGLLQVEPKLEYSETNGIYMVVWSRRKPAAIQMRLVIGVSGDGSHHAGGEGFLLGPVQELDFSNDTAVPGTPDLAWNSFTNMFFVVWSQEPWLIRGQLFNGDGSAATAKFGVANEPERDYRPQVAANSSNGEFFVSYDNYQIKIDIDAVIWNSNATLVKDVIRVAALGNSAEWRSHVAYNAEANSYFLTYNRGRSCGGSACDDVIGEVISPDGIVAAGDVPVDVNNYWASHGLEDGGISWGGIVSSTTKPEFLELYIIGGGDIGTALVRLTPAATTLVTMDTPVENDKVALPFAVAGWAIDPAATVGTGVDIVHVWAFPAGGGATFLGEATANETRADIGGTFGTQFIDSGFHLDVTSGLPDGAYSICTYAHSTVSGEFDASDCASVEVGPQPLMSLDTPAPGSVVSIPFEVGGWALDLAAPAGTTGVDFVHIWAFPGGGGSPTFLGEAPVNGDRPDVGAVFGSQFDSSGYLHEVITPLPAGYYTLVVYAHSTITDTFNNQKWVSISVVQPFSSPLMVLDTPLNGATVGASFQVGGWAIDLGAPSGTGVDAVHVWAFPAAGGSPVFLGLANMNIPRPGVAAAFGTQFANAGFNIDATPPLTAGTWHVVAYAHSTVTGTFNNQKKATVTVVP